MGRVKLSDEAKARIAKEKAEQQLVEHLASERKDLIDRVQWGFIKTPTRQFEVGERVQSGAHDHTIVLKKELDGAIYLVKNDYIQSDKNTRGYGERFQSQYWVAWHSIDKYRTDEERKKLPNLVTKDDVRFNYSQTSLSSFQSMVYYFGVDLNPDYQRDLVWTLEDKQKLIESIFNNIDIGKFAFIKRGFNKDVPSQQMYEILDGKQRLTAIMEFLEDRFKWRGLTFSDLSPSDQWHFETYSVAVAETSNMTKEQIYKYFLKLNTGGKPISTEHLEKVKCLLDVETKNKK